MSAQKKPRELLIHSEYIPIAEEGRAATYLVDLLRARKQFSVQPWPDGGKPTAWCVSHPVPQSTERSAVA